MAIAAAGIDPERLIWTPRTMITVPAMPSVRYVVRSYHELVAAIEVASWGHTIVLTADGVFAAPTSLPMPSSVRRVASNTIVGRYS